LTVIFIAGVLDFKCAELGSQFINWMGGMHLMNSPRCSKP